MRVKRQKFFQKRVWDYPKIKSILFECGCTCCACCSSKTASKAKLIFREWVLIRYACSSINFSFYGKGQDKGYYSFLMFRELKKLGTHIPTERCVDDIYSCAATDGCNSAIMLTHFNDDDNTPAKDIKLEISGNTNNVKLEYYLLDETHNLEPTREECVTAEKFASYLKMDNYANVLIKIKAF